MALLVFFCYRVVFCEPTRLNCAFLQTGICEDLCITSSSKLLISRRFSKFPSFLKGIINLLIISLSSGLRHR